MERTMIRDGRVRAWLLARADDPEAAATKLYEALQYEGGDDYVMVRVDVVDYPHNIVIPLDATSEEAFREALDRIESLRILQEISILRVVMHFPYPPHIANGYISHAELAAQHEQGVDIGEYIKAGRQGASPGHNAWG
ncbi:MAG: hypothetical protein U9R72_15060 [Chloroflexota bacterium]|nr:hypothetical protein [Chloroflexota bacterium]